MQLVTAWIINGERYNGVSALPALSLLTPLALTVVGDTVVITPPTYSGGAVSLGYSVYVDDVIVAIPGLSIPVPQTAVAQTVRVLATASRVGFANAISIVELIVPAAIWDLIGQSLQILVNNVPLVSAPIAVGGINSITVTG